MATIESENLFHHEELWNYDALRPTRPLKNCPINRTPMGAFHAASLGKGTLIYSIHSKEGFEGSRILCVDIFDDGRGRAIRKGPLRLYRCHSDPRCQMRQCVQLSTISDRGDRKERLGAQ